MISLEAVIPIVMTFITGRGLVLHFRHARSNQGQQKTLVRLYASLCHFISSKLMMYGQATNFRPDSYSIRCKFDLSLRAAAQSPSRSKVAVIPPILAFPLQKVF